MSRSMRAKVKVVSVESLNSARGSESSEKYAEKLTFSAVTDGNYEDNTYAKYTPSAQFTLQCDNPELWDVFKLGQKYYVDFTEAPA